MKLIIVDDKEDILVKLTYIFSDKTVVEEILVIKVGKDIDPKKVVYPKNVKPFYIEREEELLEEKVLKLIIDFKNVSNNIKILLDIQLSDKQMIKANQNKEPYTFANFGSVQFANKLVNNNIVKEKRIFFYTIPENFNVNCMKFINDTEKKWNIPIPRPGFLGGDEENFINYFKNMVLLDNAKCEDRGVYVSKNSFKSNN